MIVSFKIHAVCKHHALQTCIIKTERDPEKDRRAMGWVRHRRRGPRGTSEPWVQACLKQRIKNWCSICTEVKAKYFPPLPVPWWLWMPLLGQEVKKKQTLMLVPLSPMSPVPTQHTAQLRTATLSSLPEDTQSQHGCTSSWCCAVQCTARFYLWTSTPF